MCRLVCGNQSLTLLFLRDIYPFYCVLRACACLFLFVRLLVISNIGQTNQAFSTPKVDAFMYNVQMRKDVLDRLIEKNEKQDSIRKKEARFAYKDSVGAICLYLTLFPLAIWLAQDHVRFFDSDIWGIAKILWLIVLQILVIVAFKLFFDNVGSLAVLRWVRYDSNSRRWMTPLWVMYQLLIFCIIMAVVCGLIYGAYIYTQFMRIHGSEISTYFSNWHFIPHSILYFVMMLLLVWLSMALILFNYYSIKEVIKLWFNRYYFIQQILPKAKNDDWI